MSHRYLFAAILIAVPAFSALGAEPAKAPRLPLFFVQNTGQWNPDIDLAAQNAEMGVVFHDRQVEYRFAGDDSITVHVRYSGASTNHAQGLETLDARVNFLYGPDPARWKDDVPVFSSLAYREMWPGVDVVYSTSNGSLKTEFQIAPGSSPDAVRWTVEGADSVSIARDGSLLTKAGFHELREAAPQVFEQDRVTGALKSVHGAFRVLPGNTVAIQVGDYDPRNRLIFDPVIGYSSYFGGAGQSAATAIAVDSQGNSVVAGYTTSLDLAPVAEAFGSVTRTVAYVAKFAETGKLLFCTYIGGTLDNRANALALDQRNNIYIAGETTSRDFPVLKAVQPQLNGAQNAFVTEFNPAGTAIIFSTYLGGNGADQAYGIGLTAQDNIFVTGDTTSTNFPTVKPLQPANAGGQDAFVARLGGSGSKLLFSSYLGGSQDEHAAALAVDRFGEAVITGSTLSANFPVSHPFQGATGGNQDAFVTKINAPCTSFVFSTYAGGAGGTVGIPEQGSGVAVDGDEAIYVTGTTSSNNFPVTAGAFISSAPGGLVDAFAMKLTPSGQLTYSTYLGGSSVDYGNAIAVDPAGNAYVAGYTASPDYPSLNGVPTGPTGNYDLFLTKLNATGTGLIYSTVVGGSQNDTAAAIAVDRFGTAFLAGQTESSDFPTQSAAQSTLLGAGSSLVMRIPVGWQPSTFGAVTQTNTTGVAASIMNAGVTDLTAFGQPGDIPVTGDWTGTGHKQVGVFRNGTWFLDVNGNGVYDTGDRTFVFGQAGDIPVVGDWNGTGKVKAGLFRNGTFILDLSGHLSGVASGVPDTQFSFGAPGDYPVAADWNGSGSSKVGVFRNGTWLVDYSGNHVPSGPSITFGQAGDLPLVGDWDGSGTWKIGVYRKGSFLLDYNGDLAYSPAGDVTFAITNASQYGFVLQ